MHAVMPCMPCEAMHAAIWGLTRVNVRHLLAVEGGARLHSSIASLDRVMYVRLFLVNLQSVID